MEQSSKVVSVQPRVFRLADACRYLGVSKTIFNREVRPHVTEIKYGGRSVAFDRLDLDNWLEQYKSCNGRLGQSQGDRLWDVKIAGAHPQGWGLAR